MKLDLEFYEKEAKELAKDLLGKILVHEINGERLAGRIVEVEAYTGEDDKACHTYGGRRTRRTEIMYKRPGHLYVYLIYGMYHLVNIVSGQEELGQAVLIRALEPVEDLDKFAKNRYGKNYEELSSYQKKNLSNGPGKLTKAMNIDNNHNGLDLLDSQLHIEDDGYEDFEIVESKRIGIDYAEEARDYLYRFYIKDNKYVSVR